MKVFKCYQIKYARNIGYSFLSTKKGICKKEKNQNNGRLPLQISIQRILYKKMEELKFIQRKLLKVLIKKTEEKKENNQNISLIDHIKNNGR